MESLVALDAFAPGLSENHCASDKHVSMYNDEKRKEVWLLSKGDNHFMPKGTITGGCGGGHMSARKVDRFDCAPWILPDGDKTYARIATGEEGENKSKPKVGTLLVIDQTTREGGSSERFIIDPSFVRQDRGKRSGWQAWIWL